MGKPLPSLSYCLRSSFRAACFSWSFSWHHDPCTPPGSPSTASSVRLASRDLRHPPPWFSVYSENTSSTKKPNTCSSDVRINYADDRDFTTFWSQRERHKSPLVSFYLSLSLSPGSYPEDNTSRRTGRRDLEVEGGEDKECRRTGCERDIYITCRATVDMIAYAEGEIRTAVE